MANEEQLDKYRRDFCAISVALLLYNSAGGSLSPNTAVLFGSITISRPGVVLAGAWIIWCYFYWQFSKRARVVQTFRDEIDKSAGQSKSFKDYSRRQIFRAAELVAERVPQVHENERTPLNEIHRGLRSQYENGAWIHPTRGTYFRRIGFDGVGIHLPDDIWKQLDQEVQWPSTLERWKAYVLVAMKVGKRDISFETRVLPFLVGWSAVGLQVARWLWDLWLQHSAASVPNP